MRAENAFLPIFLLIVFTIFMERAVRTAEAVGNPNSIRRRSRARRLVRVPGLIVRHYRLLRRTGVVGRTSAARAAFLLAWHGSFPSMQRTRRD